MALVLSLDDDPLWIEFYGLLFEQAGYDYIGTMDEQEALSIMRTQPIDLFTTDFHRPGLGGFEFLRQVKADPVLRDIPVLGISLASRECRAKSLAEVGLDIDQDLAAYLERPVNPYEIVETIEVILHQRTTV